MDEKKTTFGYRLQLERARLALTQAEFAQAIGRSRHTVAWWETNRSLPDVRDLSSMCDIGVDGNWLVHGQRDVVRASANIDWKLMGVIAATLSAWLSENKLELDATHTGELLRVLYDANSAHSHVDIAGIQRMIKLAA